MFPGRELDDFDDSAPFGFPCDSSGEFFAGAEERRPSHSNRMPNMGMPFGRQPFNTTGSPLFPGEDTFWNRGAPFNADSVEQTGRGNANMDAGKDPFDGKDSIPIKVIHESSESPEKKSEYSRLFPDQTEEPGKRQQPYGLRKHSAGVADQSPRRPVSRGSSAPPRSPERTSKNPSSRQKSPQCSEEKAEVPVQPQPPPKKKLVGVDLVKKVMDDVSDLGHRVETFCKEYRYLDEMLTQNILKLDVIDVEGKPELRAMRKEAIRNIQDLLYMLENKGKKPPPVNEMAEAQDLETKDKENSSEQMEVENSAEEQVPCENKAASENQHENGDERKEEHDTEMKEVEHKLDSCTEESENKTEASASSEPQKDSESKNEKTEVSAAEDGQK
ncbi:unnamed protein product [Cyprideis torosa]|uniref:Uncharacterized protein n=1 Tax=Cyprideis torosa TaxID=163714 RepID=A0A7R8ZU84_9CRUS|nr:unnamed protein product [Cyprideis torosa]CAG0899957.1 unnamed protein product [Cyprideis torosa]